MAGLRERREDVRKEEGKNSGVLQDLVSGQVTATKERGELGRGADLGGKDNLPFPSIPPSFPLFFPPSLHCSLYTTFIQGWRVCACDILTMAEMAQEEHPVRS